MTQKKYKVIAICGEAGSGKDTLAKKLAAETGWHLIVSFTTRPPREKEVNGEDYFFVSNDEFAAKVLDGSMLEATQFNNWYYGTALESLDENRINIGVFNPEGIEILNLHKDIIDLKIYRLVVSERERLIRQLTREYDPDIDEIIRRLKTDREDFAYLDFFYTSLRNEYPQHTDLNVEKIMGDFQQKIIRQS